LSVRVPELTAYQDSTYAARYADFVEQVRQRETPLTGGTELSEAVARNLHKLMAYKDEYEVARLSLDPTLTAQITEQFGPDARYAYQLHPPILRALGMKKKISLGPWFRSGLRILLAMRKLRGTPMDLFGYAKVRRVERALVVEYRAMIEHLLGMLTPANHRLAVQIAALPDLIRGYEEIKLGSVEGYRETAADLLEQFRSEHDQPTAVAAASSARHLTSHT
jgi:indolepyruvate ferredoxin oxidoreductase